LIAAQLLRDRVNAIHPLLDPSGGSIDQVTYKAGRVRSGRAICFGR
jgi:hypothetical protein